jgi:hypothetical protein
MRGIGQTLIVTNLTVLFNKLAMTMLPYGGVDDHLRRYAHLAVAHDERTPSDSPLKP